MAARARSAAQNEVVAFSGGKDSTALALGMKERGEQFMLLFTPTGDELPELEEHIRKVMLATGALLVRPPAPTLESLINEYEALPNWRQRWCTRRIKIQPCIEWLTINAATATLCVGLRADEEERKGLYSEYIRTRFPMREWGWGLDDVRKKCRDAKLVPPARTDCGLCYGQQLREWWSLWKRHPEHFEKGVQFEKKYKYTFRSPSRDSWPASLEELRAEFEKGRRPRGLKEEGVDEPCRVCRF